MISQQWRVDCGAKAEAASTAGHTAKCGTTRQVGNRTQDQNMDQWLELEQYVADSRKKTEPALTVGPSPKKLEPALKEEAQKKKVESKRKCLTEHQRKEPSHQHQDLQLSVVVWLHTDMCMWAREPNIAWIIMSEFGSAVCVRRHYCSTGMCNRTFSELCLILHSSDSQPWHLVWTPEPRWHIPGTSIYSIYI